MRRVQKSSPRRLSQSAGSGAGWASAAVLASNPTATILPTARMTSSYVRYSRCGFLPQWLQRNLANAANNSEQERPAISAGFLGDSGFLNRKKASVTVSTQLKGGLARQAEPKVSCFALGGRGLLVDVHRGSKGSLQYMIIDTRNVAFENRRSFRIVECRDRFAHFLGSSAKEGWCRWSPLQAARVDFIGQSKRRGLIFCIGRDREAQKKQQPLAHLLGSPVLLIVCADRCARYSGVCGIVALLRGFVPVSCGD